VKVGDLVRHGKHDKDAIGLIVEVSQLPGRVPRSKVNWFDKYSTTWWDNFDLRVVSESR